MLQDSAFMYDISLGFLPRHFDGSDPVDRIIYDEDQEVSELYFVVKGFIGYGFQYWGTKVNGNSIQIAKQQKGYHLICDHYVVNKKRSNFIYLALEQTHCYALTRKYLHKYIFPKYQEHMRNIQASSLSKYHTHVFRVINKIREKMMVKLNSKSPKFVEIKYKTMEIPDCYNNVQFYRDKYIKRHKCHASFTE